MKSGQITIKDIAKELNVSPSTVSRALKNHPDISQETKRQVNELAKKLDYQPNTIAQSLRQSKTFTLGVVIPNLVHHFFSTVISGMESVAHEHNYNLIITQSNEDEKREMENIRALLSSRVDGIFVSMSRYTENIEHFKMVEKRNIPLIFFDRVCESLPTHRVIIEDFEGAFAAVQYLIRSGCRRIVHFSGPKNLRITHERYRGYQEAHQQFGLPALPELVMKADNRQEGDAAVKTLIEHKVDFDAIFTVNDDTAIGALQALSAAGVESPSQVSVMGFGDDPMSQIISPTLSSVKQPGFEMGQAVMNLYLDQANLKKSSESFVPLTQAFPTELVLRGSTH